MTKEVPSKFSHPIPEDLQEYSLGEPSRELEIQIYKHIEECEECLEKVCEMMRRKSKLLQYGDNNPILGCR